jgi:hypothetical protein
MRSFITISALAIFVCVPVTSRAQEHSSEGGQSVPPSTPVSDQNKNTTRSAGTETPLTPSAQSSLADAARKSREQKKSEKPAKVFTNDNIPTSGGISVAGAQPAGKEGAASADTTASASGNPSGKDEKAWRDKFAKLRQKLQMDQENLDVMQRELGVISMQYYPDPNKAMQQQLSRDDINKKTSDIDNKKKDVANDEQAISDAEDDLRKAGGDPGWAR